MRFCRWKLCLECFESSTLQEHCTCGGGCCYRRGVAFAPRQTFPKDACLRQLSGNLPMLSCFDLKSKIINWPPDSAKERFQREFWRLRKTIVKVNGPLFRIPKHRQGVHGWVAFKTDGVLFGVLFRNNKCNLIRWSWKKIKETNERVTRDKKIWENASTIDWLSNQSSDVPDQKKPKWNIERSKHCNHSLAVCLTEEHRGV